MIGIEGCVKVCKCVCERDRERELVCVFVRVRVCVCAKTQTRMDEPVFRALNPLSKTQWLIVSEYCVKRQKDGKKKEEEEEGFESLSSNFFFDMGMNTLAHAR